MSEVKFTKSFKERHGHAKENLVTRSYTAWMNMKERCRGHQDHPHCYSGKGVTVCERWFLFSNFLEDMGEPGKGMTLDRIDNDGIYEPLNCRWATRKQQQNNRATNRILVCNGKTQTLAQWAEEVGIRPNTILYRLKRGWSEERSVNEPLHESNAHRRKRLYDGA